jgi:hypothetical protein
MRIATHATAVGRPRAAGDDSPSRTPPRPSSPGNGPEQRILLAVDDLGEQVDEVALGPDDGDRRGADAVARHRAGYVGGKDTPALLRTAGGWDRVQLEGHCASSSSVNVGKRTLRVARGAVSGGGTWIVTSAP